ncbi:MAG: ribosomal protein S18-alanine N-acetyltransferase [Dehalococcoidales bacterium]|nr:ribosomal protein S18-alanine N-acetyltransferase [Dehalococcoidales bacterium]
MPCYVRLMRREDIAQVTEIDREAFPTLWPPANYRRELENRLARYIVAYDEGEMIEEPEMKAVPQKGFSGLVSKLMQLFSHDRFFGDELSLSGRQYIFGFAGFWIMAGEAHITNIAVWEKHRRQGIGELLLISLIDLATELDVRLLTLEVRASNIAAQRLYSKYGFTQVGLRRGYYTDNREDGVLMSLENVTSAPVQADLQRLKQAHSQRWGIVAYRVAR